MSFAHNQPRWTDHEQHARYFAMDFLPFAGDRHFFADGNSISEIGEATPRKCVATPVARSCADAGREGHGNIVMIDLTRHHRLARELLRRREAYDSYLAELTTLISGISRSNALATPNGLIAYNFTPMK